MAEAGSGVGHGHHAYDLGLAGKIYLCNMQDLGSRYKFLPMAGGYPVGEEIAGYLNEKFDRYGAPLVLKRDNEGNMNHSIINDVLSESFVLPLNNPPYYAPYNGAIEESQREVKRCLRDKLALDLPAPGDHITAYAEAAVNDLNHRHRCHGFHHDLPQSGMDSHAHPDDPLWVPAPHAA